MISLLFPRFETLRNRLYKQLLLIIILQKTSKNHLLDNKTQENSRFSKSTTHTYINTINYHYYLVRHYRKAKQRVSSFLNTNSCSLHFMKYKNIISHTKFLILNFDRVFRKYKLKHCMRLKLHLAYLPNFFPFEPDYLIIINMLRLNNFPKKTSNKIIFLP